MSREPKILRRIVNTSGQPGGSQTQFSTLSNARSVTGSTFASRLAADPTRQVGFDGKKLGFDPLDESSGIDVSSVAGKVQSALLPTVGYIDKTVVWNLIKRLKVPIIATIGIAAVAGLSYLAYRLYKSRQENQPKQAQEALKEDTAETIMEDFAKVAPDVLANIPWYQSIKQKVEDAIKTKSGDQLVEELAKISASLKEKQMQFRPVEHSGGSLLDTIVTRGMTKGMGMMSLGNRTTHFGSGVRIPMY